MGRKGEYLLHVSFHRLITLKNMSATKWNREKKKRQIIILQNGFYLSSGNLFTENGRFDMRYGLGECIHMMALCIEFTLWKENFRKWINLSGPLKEYAFDIQRSEMQTFFGRIPVLMCHPLGVTVGRAFQEHSFKMTANQKMTVYGEISSMSSSLCI